MLKRLIHGRSDAIASAAMIIASFSIISRLVGLVRDRILAGTFGASESLDIYFAAFRLPDLLFQLMVVGALSASFIPLFTKYYKEKNPQKAWDFTNKILNLIILLFGAFVLILVWAMPWVSPLIAPGFSPEALDIMTHLSRIMLLAQFFLAISMVFGSALQGAKRFFFYSLAPIFYNVGIIFGALFLTEQLGVMGVAWGVVLGGWLHFFTQWLGMRFMGYRYRTEIAFFDKDIIYTFKHMLPRVLGLAVNQLNFVFMTVLASFLAAGSVTVLQFAYNMNFFPVGVIAVSYAVAAFPTLCEASQKKGLKKFKDTFSRTVRQMLFFLIPATALFIILRVQIVRVAFGAGDFSWTATYLTANTLAFFMLSLVAQAMIFLLVRSYFALEDTLTPFAVGLGAAIVNIAAAYWFTGVYGVVGFGIAYSIGAYIQLILLWIPLRQRVGGLGGWKILQSFGLLSIAGLGCAISAQLSKYVFAQVLNLDTFMGIFLQGLAAGCVGMIIYFALAYAFDSEELSLFINGLKRRLLKKAVIEEEIVTGV